jgi:F-type H+-transporting ATPase subunit a
LAHGKDGHGTEQANDPQAQIEQASEPNTSHDEPGHATPTDDHGEAIHGEVHGEDHAEEHSSTPHLYNLVSGWIAPLVPQAMADNLEAFIDPIYSLTIILVLSIFFISLSRKISHREPGRQQAAVEILLGGLYNLFYAIIGDTARRYTPFLGTLFIFILFNNLAGILPLGHASTSNFSTTTFALGAMTFLYVQGIALKENGILGYLHHMAGSPKTGMDWGFSLLLFPLHLLGELIKPVSLALRLFGNIFGEDTLVATMVILGYLISKGIGGAFLPEGSAAFGFLPGIPLQLPFYFLGLLSSTIQALVFTLLATVYIALWLPHGDHDHQEAHGH